MKKKGIVYEKEKEKEKEWYREKVGVATLRFTSIQLKLKWSLEGKIENT